MAEQFKNGSVVFFSAFMKKDNKVFYLCKGIVRSTPKDKPTFRVEIIAVGDRPIGKSPGREIPQALLLRRVISKKGSELAREPSQFMKPAAWITIIKE